MDIFAFRKRNDRRVKMLTEMEYFFKEERGCPKSRIINIARQKMMFLLLASALILPGCRKDTVSISGKINGAVPGRYLLVRQVRPGVLDPVDSLIPSTGGTFRLRLQTKLPTYYLLSMGGHDYFTLLAAPGEKIIFNAPADSISRPVSVSGSAGTSVMMEFDSIHTRVLHQLGELTAVYNENHERENPRLPVIMDSLDRRASEIVSEFRAKSLDYIEQNSSSMVAIYLLNQHVVPGVQLFDPVADSKVFVRVDSMLYATYPESDLVIDLHSFTAGLKERVTMSQGQEGAVATGTLLPDIALPSPNGDTLHLSSLRGRVVLVDFWAAWCPPCREENPNLVRMYDLFHRYGFDIFQVSLDLKKEDWTEAIRKDRLGRWMHVSDLRYRDSEVVKEFGLTEIPANFLIDREGRVIGVNLRGEELQKKLEELFSQQ